MSIRRNPANPTNRAKSFKSLGRYSGAENSAVEIPGLRYLVRGVDKVGKTLATRAHSLSAARRSHTAHAVVRGEILDTLRSKPVVMAILSNHSSRRTKARKTIVRK